MSQDKLTENGLEMMVKVQDIDRDLMIEWPISVFRSKLDLLQQMSDVSSLLLFKSFNTKF